ncbi:MAG: hypothetical protein ABI760_13055 [Ferruginibacter sp.]
MIVLIFTTLFFYGCTREKVTVQVIRKPSIEFNYNSTSSWKADNSSFAAISKVVVYPDDLSLQGVLYNRLTLQSSGHDNTGNNLQLIISFDAVNVSQLVGLYSTDYSTQWGLAEVQLFDLTNSSNLSAYNLCNNYNAIATFRIQRQNTTERLISGVFQMTLCNSRDSTQKIDIINGALTDIHY